MIQLLLLLVALVEPANVSISDSIATPSVVQGAASAPDSNLNGKLQAIQNAWDVSPNADSAARATQQAPSLVGSILQILTSLTMLILLVVGGWFLLRRARKPRNTGNSSSSLVDVLEMRSLGPGRSIQLVRIHNRVVAVVSTPHAIAAVAEFRGEEAAEVVAETGTGRATMKEFSASLDALMDRFRSPRQEVQAEVES